MITIWSNAADEVPSAEFARVVGRLIASRNASSEPKEKPAWLTHQVRNWTLASSPNPVATGRVVSEQGDAAGKKRTPALKMPQLRQLIGGLIDTHFEDKTARLPLPPQHPLVAAQ